jgi:hypothetical protein
LRFNYGSTRELKWKDIQEGPKDREGVSTKGRIEGDEIGKMKTTHALIRLKGVWRVL